MIVAVFGICAVLAECGGPVDSTETVTTTMPESVMTPAATAYGDPNPATAHLSMAMGGKLLRD